MRSICVLSFVACLTLATANADSVIMYGGNGGHTPAQVMNGAPPSANNGWLVVVNQSTGAVSPLGQPAGVTRISGLAFAPGDTLYGSTINGNNAFPPSGPAAQTSDLIQINPNNGSLVADIGAIKANGTAIEISDLAAQPGTGVLFGISAGSASGAPGLLYTINAKTGAATLVGSTGNFFGGIAFAPNGTLYMLSSDLDMTTGNVINQELKTLNPLNAQTLTMLALPSAGPSELYGAFGINPLTGVLFAGNGDQGGLYTLNANTGAATFIADTTPEFIGDIDFRVVPEPVSSGLCIVGLFGLAAIRRYRR